jgi:hypothetical protein
MNNRFGKFISGTLLIGIALSSLYYYIVCQGLRQTKESFPGRLNTILYDTTRYDVVFMGTSHMSWEVDPFLFDSITRLYSYNAGIEGASFSAIDIFIHRMVANHHPKFVFLNIDLYLLEKENSLYNFPQYYPHMGDTDIDKLSVRKAELSYGKYAPFIAISYLDDYLKGNGLHGWTGLYPSDDLSHTHRGFSPVYSSYMGANDSFVITFSYDTANIKKLENLCRYCTSHGCQMLFTMAPIYRSFYSNTGNASDFYRRLRMIEKEYHIPELNFYTSDKFQKKMFANRTHLNHNGAKLYSCILANRFNKYIKCSFMKEKTLLK